MTQADAISPPAGAKAKDQGVTPFLMSWSLPIAIVLLALFFYSQAPVFLSVGNWISISVQVATLMIIAIPFAVLLMAGRVDLSVGSMLALSGVVAGLSFESLGVRGAVALTLALGAGVGLVNGLLVGGLGMSPIILTLGGLTLMRGVAQWLSPSPLFGFPEAFSWIGYGRVAGLPMLTWIMLAVVLAGVLAMRMSAFGRHAVAIGANERAAYLVGVRVKLMVVLLYVAVGLAAAPAGLLTIARINSAPSGTLGVGMELSVLTAVLLGACPSPGARARSCASPAASGFWGCCRTAWC